MTESIIVAILALFGTLAGSFFSNAKATAVMDERIKDVKEDITVLSQRVEKHNNLIERMVCVEASTKSAHKRIDELKNQTGGK
jgi:cell division protein FtsB